MDQRLVVQASKERVFSDGFFFALPFNNSKTRRRANQPIPTAKIQKIGSQFPIVFSFRKKKGQHQPKWLSWPAFELVAPKRATF
jgi:hypothetical protein